MRKYRIYSMVAGVCILCSSAMAGTTIEVTPPFAYADAATAIATAAGAVLAITFGWRIGFRLVKKLMNRVSGGA